MEELKMILEMIANTTGAAKQFGITWLIIHGLEVLFSYALGGAAILGAYKLANKGILVGRDSTFAAGLRAYVCPDKNYGKLTRDEKDSIISAIKRGLNT